MRTAIWETIAETRFLTNDITACFPDNEASGGKWLYTLTVTCLLLTCRDDAGRKAPKRCNLSTAPARRDFSVSPLLMVLLSMRNFFFSTDPALPLPRATRRAAVNRGRLWVLSENCFEIAAQHNSGMVAVREKYANVTQVTYPSVVLSLINQSVSHPARYVVMAIQGDVVLFQPPSYLNSARNRAAPLQSPI